MQKTVLQEKVISHFGSDLTGKTIAVWGLAFKPKTDDIREAPALVLIEQLLALGAKVCAYDPEAMDNVRQLMGQAIRLVEHPMEALNDADALAIVTEWSQFRTPDVEQMCARMKQHVIFDGRNLYDPQLMAEHGFTYYSIGRPVARPT